MNSTQDKMMEDLERLKHEAELQERDTEIARLRRRVDDLEDFLLGVALQFKAISGRT